MIDMENGVIILIGLAIAAIAAIGIWIYRLPTKGEDIIWEDLAKAAAHRLGIDAPSGSVDLLNIKDRMKALFDEEMSKPEIALQLDRAERSGNGHAMIDFYESLGESLIEKLEQKKSGLGSKLHWVS
jgi:hypothetical protein